MDAVGGCSSLVCVEPSGLRLSVRDGKNPLFQSRRLLVVALDVWLDMSSIDMLLARTCFARVIHSEPREDTIVSGSRAAL